jgi:hypothetical protein
MITKPPSADELVQVLYRAGFRTDLSDEKQVREAMNTLKQLVAKLAAWNKE